MREAIGRIGAAQSPLAAHERTAEE